MIEEVIQIVKTTLVAPTSVTSVHHGHSSSPTFTITRTSSATSTATYSPVPLLPVFERATTSGENTLWVVFFLMVLASAGFTALAWKLPASRNLYHVVTTLVTIIASLSYFAMATGQGVSYHHIVERESHKHIGDTTRDVYRQVYWARYVDWSLTTPLLLLDLSLLAGLNGSSMFIAIVADIIMVLTGLFAAFGDEGTPQKWGWYVIACVAFAVIIWQLAVHGRGSAFAKSDRVGSFFTAIAGFTLVVWTAYPIVWAIADGSRSVGVNAEIIIYAVLDILAKPIFGAWLLLAHSRLPEAQVSADGFWAHGVGGDGQIRVGDDDDGA